MKSIHNFKPGDRVVYSFTLEANEKTGRKKRHLHGTAIVVEKLQSGTCEIVLPRGRHKICYAHELRMAQK